MFGDGSLTFREFIMREPLPLATIHDAVLEFLRGRTDAMLFGAHAVNAYAPAKGVRKCLLFNALPMNSSRGSTR
jgi:hypothetical protein